MKRVITAICVLTVLGLAELLLKHSSYAEPLPDPKGFYPHDYVQDAMRKDVPSPTPTPSARAGAARTLPKVNSRGSSKGSDAKAPSVPQNDGAEKATQEQPKTMVMVYANSKDREHFNRVVREVIALNASAKAQVVAILHMGDYHNVTKQQQESLQRAGVVVQGVPLVPDYMQELKSPTWEVYRGEGTALVSGIFDIRRFFGVNGAFKVSQEEEQGIEPPLEMDGF